MSRTTIDFGIDLGTTNSAVALLRGTATEPVKNNLDHEITPSAVFISKRDEIHVGARAKQRITDDNSTEDVFMEFKRQMGTDHEYAFKSSGRRMRAEALSAEVLKSLRGDVQQRLGEELGSAVITVPAAFEQRQCAATRRAAELAGFAQSPLLQEPVAAALAHGFQADAEKAFWLVFDFGGGTFDAALIRAEEGSIQVVNHGGDNFLGGSDIDWAVVEQLIVPTLRSEHGLRDFQRGNTRWKVPFLRMKHAVEQAKILLSRAESAFLEDCRFKNDAGEEIEVEFPLRRADLVRVAEPIVRRAVEISQRVLRESKLAPSALAKVILVGGPTLAPWFREIVQEGLGAALDFSVDPLTVVARGAAVFAGTQRLTGDAAPRARRGQYAVELNYPPIGPDPDPTVRGLVRGEGEAGLAGFTIEVVNEATRWRSGQVRVKEDGGFRLTLLAERGRQNVFAIELRDGAGSLQETVPASLSYTIGAAISEQPVIHSIGVAMKTNEVTWLIEKGAPLPARGTHPFRATSALRAGERADTLTIPIVEGDRDSADRNKKLVVLIIRGSDIRRDLSSGSEVEVTLHFDESRLLKVTAYLPSLDEEFPLVVMQNESIALAERLRETFDRELRRLDSLEKKAKDADEAPLAEAVRALRTSDDRREIERSIAAAFGDPDAALKAESRLLEWQVEIDAVEDQLAWPAMVAEARESMAEVERLTEEERGRETQARGSKLCRECEEAISAEKPDRLKRKLRELKKLENDLVLAQDGFWVGYFQWLETHKAESRDAAKTARLLDQGRQCVEKNNVAGLRSVVVQLHDLLPPKAAEEAAQRGYGSTLIR